MAHLTETDLQWVRLCAETGLATLTKKTIAVEEAKQKWNFSPLRAVPKVFGLIRSTATSIRQSHQLRLTERAVGAPSVRTANSDMGINYRSANETISHVDCGSELYSWNAAFNLPFHMVWWQCSWTFQKQDEWVHFGLSARGCVTNRVIRIIFHRYKSFRVMVLQCTVSRGDSRG